MIRTEDGIMANDASVIFPEKLLKTKQQQQTTKIFVKKLEPR